MNLQKKMMGSFFTAIVLLGTIGTGFVSAQDPDETPAGPEDKPTITSEQATQTVLEAYPDATIEKTELVKEDGVLVYEVELDNEPDVLVDANSGEIIGTDDE